MKSIRKLTKVSGGDSYAVTLPKEVIRKWKWQDRQKVIVETDDRGKRFVIRDWKGKK